jgi:isopenicillin N synthase-like dioxygenase
MYPKQLTLCCSGSLTFVSTRQVHNTGFFSVVGTGLSKEAVQRQYDLGQAFFALPHDEKSKSEYKCDFAQGNYFGYREIYEKTIMGTDVKDNVELFNHAKFTPQYEGEPRHPFFKPYTPELEDFSRVSIFVGVLNMLEIASVLMIPGTESVGCCIKDP